MADDPHTFTPDVPGRGAWTLRGGLINNDGGSFGYYQQPSKKGGLRRPGALYVRDGDTSDAAYCVYLAVRQIQLSLTRTVGLDEEHFVDGIYGPNTQSAMSDWQTSVGLSDPSGIFGPRSAALFFRPQMVQIGKRSMVPWAFLHGMASRESGFDPAAVGVSGWDHGFVQINLSPDAHGESVTREEALRISYSLNFAAKDLRSVYNRWAGNTSADPWDIALANHNSPALAQQWARDGQPPYVEGRVFQIEDYVIDIRRRAEEA